MALHHKNPSFGDWAFDESEPVPIDYEVSKPPALAPILSGSRHSDAVSNDSGGKAIRSIPEADVQVGTTGDGQLEVTFTRSSSGPQHRKEPSFAWSLGRSDSSGGSEARSIELSPSPTKIRGLSIQTSPRSRLGIERMSPRSGLFALGLGPSPRAMAASSFDHALGTIDAPPNLFTTASSGSDVSPQGMFASVRADPSEPAVSGNGGALALAAAAAVELRHSEGAQCWETLSEDPMDADVDLGNAGHSALPAIDHKQGTNGVIASKGAAPPLENKPPSGPPLARAPSLSGWHSDDALPPTNAAGPARIDEEEAELTFPVSKPSGQGTRRRSTYAGTSSAAMDAARPQPHPGYFDMIDQGVNKVSAWLAGAEGQRVAPAVPGAPPPGYWSPGSSSPVGGAAVMAARDAPVTSVSALLAVPYAGAEIASPVQPSRNRLHRGEGSDASSGRGDSRTSSARGDPARASDAARDAALARDRARDAGASAGVAKGGRGQEGARGAESGRSSGRSVESATRGDTRVSSNGPGGYGDLMGVTGVAQAATDKERLANGGDAAARAQAAEAKQGKDGSARPTVNPNRVLDFRQQAAVEARTKEAAAAAAAQEAANKKVKKKGFFARLFGGGKSNRKEVDAKSSKGQAKPKGGTMDTSSAGGSSVKTAPLQHGASLDSSMASASSLEHVKLDGYGYAVPTSSGRQQGGGGGPARTHSAGTSASTSGRDSRNGGQSFGGSSMALSERSSMRLSALSEGSPPSTAAQAGRGGGSKGGVPQAGSRNALAEAYLERQRMIALADSARAQGAPATVAVTANGSGVAKADKAMLTYLKAVPAAPGVAAKKEQRHR